MEKDIDYSRRQDSLLIFKLSPLVLIITAAVIYLTEVDRITIDRITLWGASKYIWALALEILVGLALIFGAESLVTMLSLITLAKHRRSFLYPWDIIIQSAYQLIICIALLVLFNYSQKFILDNVKQINNILTLHRSLPSYVLFMEYMAWGLIALFIFIVFSSVVFNRVRELFNTKQDFGLNSDVKKNEENSIKLAKYVPEWHRAEQALRSGDIAGALYLFKKLEKEGSLHAIAEIGNIYEHGGGGVKQDYEEAKKWYIKALNYAAPAAYLQLGRLYYFGRGVKQDYEKAFSYFINLKDYDQPGALYIIGKMYELGQGVKSDYDIALSYYKKASQLGHALAQRDIGKVYMKKGNYVSGFKIWFKGTVNIFKIAMHDPKHIDRRTHIFWGRIN